MNDTLIMKYVQYHVLKDEVDLGGKVRTNGESTWTLYVGSYHFSDMVACELFICFSNDMICYYLLYSS